MCDVENQRVSYPWANSVFFLLQSFVMDNPLQIIPQRGGGNIAHPWAFSGGIIRSFNLDTVLMMKALRMPCQWVPPPNVSQRDFNLASK